MKTSQGMDPDQRRRNATKGAKASPWSKGPVCRTNRARDVFAANRRARELLDSAAGSAAQSKPEQKERQP